MIKSIVKKKLQGVKAHRILEVGPGYSTLALTAAKVTGASEIYFIDCNDDVLSWQAERCAERGLQCFCRKAFLEEGNEIRNIPGKFELVICTEVLEHLNAAETVLAELVEKMCSQGLIIITVPSKLSEKWLKLINPSYMRNEPYGHVREFSRRELKNLVRGAGLEIKCFFPTNPHFFLSTTWFYGTRMKADASTGAAQNHALLRWKIYRRLERGSKKIFKKTFPILWGYVLPRNYFVIASRVHVPPPLA